MEIKARAKINLSLDVTGRREDGYHLVRMVMQSVDVYDTLVFEKTNNGKICIFTDNPDIPVDEHNLIWKAVQLLRDEFGIAEGVSCTLTKRIPAAAGLAGGSTDAAAALNAVNALFDLGLSKEELCRRGVKIGADIPFCILGGTVLAEGIGEILTPLSPLPDCTILLAKPAVGVSTQFVYTHLDALSEYAHPNVDAQVRALEEGNLAEVTEHIGNVLELVTIPEHPVIDEIKQMMTEYGAEHACMSGSGPTVFGIFTDAETANRACEAIRSAGIAHDLFVTKPFNREVENDR